MNVRLKLRRAQLQTHAARLCDHRQICRGLAGVHDALGQRQVVCTALLPTQASCSRHSPSRWATPFLKGAIMHHPASGFLGTLPPTQVPGPVPACRVVAAVFQMLTEASGRHSFCHNPAPLPSVAPSGAFYYFW